MLFDKTNRIIRKISKTLGYDKPGHYFTPQNELTILTLSSPQRFKDKNISGTPLSQIDTIIFTTVLSRTLIMQRTDSKDTFNMFSYTYMDSIEKALVSLFPYSEETIAKLLDDRFALYDEAFMRTGKIDDDSLAAFVYVFARVLFLDKNSPKPFYWSETVTPYISDIALLPYHISATSYFTGYCSTSEEIIEDCVAFIDEIDELSHRGV